MHRQFVIAGALIASLLVPATALAAGTPSHATPAHAKPAPIKVAPADEYFGRMKMSILGITNTIRDTRTREGFDPANAAKYYQTLAFAEDALQDWANKYPQDSWIPRRAYDMSHDFWLMHTPQGNVMAGRCRIILFRQFPHNHWAVIARSETAAKVAPVVAQAAATGTPAKP